MFDLLWQGRYYLLLILWLALLGLGTWTRYRVLALSASRQAQRISTGAYQSVSQ